MVNLEKALKVALTAAAMATATISLAHAEELVVVTSAGAFGDSLKENFFDPFTKETGIEIIVVPASTNEGIAALRTQAESNSVQYDVITTNSTVVLTSGDLLVDLDCESMSNLMANQTPGACDGKRVVRTVGASLVAYNTDAFPNGGPTSWADFFDVAKFPGKRCIPGGSVENELPIMMALLADGVSPDDLYPLDYDRAFAKLRELKPHIGAYWTSFSMSQQLLRDGECVVNAMTNGRALSLRNEGFPLSISWNQAIDDNGYWSIAKGAPNESAAYKFLDFWMTRPEAHLAFYKQFFYGTANAQVVNLMDGEDLKNYHAAPENLPHIIPQNAEWLAANQQEISRRFTEFLSE